MLCINSLRQWRDEYMEYMRAVDFMPFNNTPFKIAFSFPLGLPGMVNCRFNAGTIIRTPEPGKCKEDVFGFTTSEMGTVHYGQRGRQVQNRRGEAVLTYDTEPFYQGSQTGFGGIGIMMPRVEFESRGVRPDDAVMQCLRSRQCEALRLLRYYVHSLEKSSLNCDGVFGEPTALREISLRHIYDLVALAVSWRGAVGESDLGAVADTRLRAALGYIAANFDNPQLEVEMVARQLGISTRYLQRLMKNAGRSYTAVVNEMRLQKAFNELSASRNGRSILEIAMRAGFSDISYFNRLFRARFADTPGGVAAGVAKQ